MNSIDYVAKILKQEGVEWMPLYPSNPLIEAVAKEGIRPVAFRHERGAVMAADGYGRVSDRKKTSVVAMQSQAGVIRRLKPAGGRGSTSPPPPAKKASLLEATGAPDPWKVLQ